MARIPGRTGSMRCTCPQTLQAMNADIRVSANRKIPSRYPHYWRMGRGSASNEQMNRDLTPLSILAKMSLPLRIIPLASQFWRNQPCLTNAFCI
jgi:hypothetical protein